MADNVLMAYHIVVDPQDKTKHVLNTKKLYKWRITEHTKGNPVPGNVALVETRFYRKASVMIYATKEVANDISDLKSVKSFTDHRDQPQVNAAFDAL